MAHTYEYLLLEQNIESDKSSKFFGFSMMFHVALAIGTAFLTVPALDLTKETIVIELTETKPMKPVPPPKLSLAAPKGVKTNSTKGSARVRNPAPAAPLMAKDSDLISGPTKKSKTSVAKIAQIKSHTSGGQATIAKTAPSRVGIPETLEDIAAPVLETDGVEAAQVGALGDNEFESDFKNVDHSNEAALRAQKAALDDEAKQMADEKDTALAALEDDVKSQSRAMQDALEATRTKNAAALAQVRASEKAQAEKAARDAALAAQQAKAASGRGDNGAVSGKGNGTEGADTASAARAGEPNGIRSLDQLKQMPGNPKPQYSNDERFKRHQGMVVFYAYINADGRPSQFRLAQSTGFRNLDGKTLAALKKWRFYPGQDGWAELPFKWDLKGGVQEMPTLLRRTGSR